MKSGQDLVVTMFQMILNLLLYPQINLLNKGQCKNEANKIILKIMKNDWSLNN